MAYYCLFYFKLMKTSKQPIPKQKDQQKEQVDSLKIGFQRVEIETQVLEEKLGELEKLLDEREVEITNVKKELDEQKRLVSNFKDSFSQYLIYIYNQLLNLIFQIFSFHFKAPESIEKLMLSSKNFLTIFGTGSHANADETAADFSILHPSYPLIKINATSMLEFGRIVKQQTSNSSVFRKVLTTLLDEYVPSWYKLTGKQVINKHGNMFYCAFSKINL